MSKPLFAAVLLAASELGLTACSDREGLGEETASEGAAGLEIANARMMLPPVAGNPAAVYFDVEYNGDSQLAIAAADVTGADRAELHDMAGSGGAKAMSATTTVALRPGTGIHFEPGGTHVMAFDLSPDLVAGGTTEATLTLANGDKHSFPVEVRSAGDER